MNGEESIVETPDGVRAVCRYWTPEWRAMIHGLRDTFIPVSAVILTGAGIFGLMMFAPDLDAGAFAVGCFGAAGLAYALSWGLNYALSEAGGGYLLAPRGNASLAVEFTRTEIRIRRKRVNVTAARATSVIYMEPHRKREEELRQEQRAGRPLTPVYRDAFEVWLKDGLRVSVLAAIADAEGAKSVVRLLQEADARVTGAASRQFGPQPVLD